MSSLFKIILAAYSILVFGLAYFVPTGHWVAGFMMLSLPILLLFLLFCLIVTLVFKSKGWWLYALLFLLSFPFWPRTVGGIFSTTKEVKATGKSFSVLSYNVKTFDVLNYIDNKNPKNALDNIKWAIEEESDIKCFQEFYSYSKRDHFNTLQQFKEAGYKYKTVMHPIHAQNEENFFGLAIVSKYPIIGRGEQVFADMNGLVYADIKIQKDTIRIINVHQRSMVVRFTGIKKAYKSEDYEEGKAQTRSVLGKLKRGFVNHAKEVKQVEKIILSSPYPVILCGDFNEVPYSFSYGTIRKHLNNAFEDAGSGLGFSYRDQPKFIRIDNQFYDNKAIKVEKFSTRPAIKYSDHYPIVGHYKLL